MLHLRHLGVMSIWWHLPFHSFLLPPILVFLGSSPLLLRFLCTEKIVKFSLPVPEEFLQSLAGTFWFIPSFGGSGLSSGRFVLESFFWIIVTTSRLSFTFLFPRPLPTISNTFPWDKYWCFKEQERGDFLYKSLLCLTTPDMWKITICFYKLRIWLDYYFLFPLVMRGDLWDLRWMHTKLVYDKVEINFPWASEWS